MFRRDFFQHENPEGQTSQDRVSQIHRRLVGGVSENLYQQAGIAADATTLSRRIVNRWMESPRHRENILSPHSTHVGVCTLRRRDTIRATQVFAKVAAYARPAIPRRVRPGTRLSISFHSPGEVPIAVARYDLWDPASNRTVTAPTVFADSLRFPDTTGTVRTRFYVVEEGTYVRYHGPQVTVTPSP